MKQTKPLSLKWLSKKLEAHYGKRASPRTRDPFQLIIWESIGYLVDDEKREVAFNALSEQIGLRPIDLLAAPLSALTAITRLGGIHPELRAQRLKEIAQITLTEFDGDLTSALKLPPPEAIKALRQYPSIGEPGAEKILMLTGTRPVLALESNGLRVLLRLGFGEEKKNYSASYKSAREAVADQTGKDCEFLIGLHQLLREHGKLTCKTTNPRCDKCPITESCRYFLRRKRQ